jgi:hypothetical protein
MLRNRLRLPGHGTLVAYLALFIALGGTAYAANTIGRDDIIDDSIQSVDIKNQTVTANDIAGAYVDATISLSAIPNGRCSQFTLLINGVKPGDSAIISTQAPLQAGIVFYAQGAPSKGHVTMDGCNFSGGAMTAISNFPIRVITFR